MRITVNDHIWDLWQNGTGLFIGEDGAPHGRVTVEIGWQLRKSDTSTIGSYLRGPIRWFQRSDNSQTETELPTVKTIDIDRTIDVDAATCKITILNQRMLDNGQVPPSGSQGTSVGRPGFYWPGRGESEAATTRWGWTQNQWNDVLQPNALLRTYQGYGGRGKTISQALADGNIMQTGLWLVDSVRMDAKSGMMEINCRDVAKLLIDQMIYPPLIPRRKQQGTNNNDPRYAYYPLSYFRWIFVNHPVIPYGDTIYHTGYSSVEGKLHGAAASSHYDDGTVIHPGSDAIDGDGETFGADPDTYWLSEGRANEGREYLEFDISGSPDIGGVNIQPIGGNYTCYVSIVSADYPSSGGWVKNDDNPSLQTPPAGPINYVARQGIGWERPITIDLGKKYTNVTKIRITLKNLQKIGKSPPGAGPYRCGIRDLSIGNFAKTVSGADRVIVGIGRGSNDPTDTTGYWIVGSDGGVFTFGGLKFYGSDGGKFHNTGDLATSNNDAISGIATDSVTAKGYRLCSRRGGVFCFGQIYYHGSIVGGTSRHGTLAEDRFVEQIENGDGGKTGYYLLRSGGGIDEFGSATWHGDHTFSNPDDVNALYFASALGVKKTVPRGYWTMTTLHEIQGHGGAGTLPYSGGGGAVSFGGSGFNVPTDGLATALEVHPNGEGFWTCDSLGHVRAYGWSDLAHTQPLQSFGGLPGIGVNIVIGQQKGVVDLVCTPSGDGYWIVGQDGGVYAFGDATFSGSLPEQYQKVGDGNYTDYTDIVKDLLLWSGWWFRNPSNPGADPQVFGTIESTGIYSPDNLTEDFFDKKPVIDVINSLKEIVGYINFADEIGAYHFRHPNIFTPGNWLSTGVPTSRMPVIDEKQQITSYDVDFNDTDARSQIIIATDDPALNLPDTKSVTLNSQWAAETLRGIVRPALWVNGKFLTRAIQTTMAHLIDLHLFMQQRQGNLSMAANPVLQIDDQVQIYERSTSETYIHYIRGYNTHMDLDSGEYTQTLQTHWLGDGSSWAINYEPVDVIGDVGGPTSGGDAAPSFVDAAPPSGSLSGSYSYQFTASGSPAPTFSITSGSLPSGLILNAFSGLLSGTPTAPGSFSFNVTASNGVGSNDTVAVSLIIGSSSGTAPALQNYTPSNGTVGSSYSYTFTATGNPNPTFSMGGDFLSAPSSGIIRISNQSNVEVSNKSFSGLASQVAIIIDGCTNVYLHDLDFDGCQGCILLDNCTGFKIEDIRARDTGDGTIGSGKSNVIQIAHSTENGSGGIRRVLSYGGDTEDMISIFMSGGQDAAHPLVIEDCHLESPLPSDPLAWSSSSGTGTFLGDAGGSDIICRNNTYLNCGQVGIGVSVGNRIHVTDNILYGANRTGNNVGIGLAGGGSNIEVARNRVFWIADGNIPNPYYDAGTSGTISGISPQTNVFQDTSIDPADLAVDLGTSGGSGADVVPGLVLNTSSGNLHGTPTTAGTYSFNIRATNSSGSDQRASSLLVNASGGGGGGGSSPPPSGGYFSLLSVGASLPGGMTAAGADAAAAAAVNNSTWEPRPDNNTANHTTVSQPNTLASFGVFDGTWNSTYRPRISGNFQGTTDEIIQWAAYKWGWSDELIRAEAIAESNWHQSQLGDYEAASGGHRVFDRSDDPTPTSFSIVQIHWYFIPSGVTSSDPGSSYPNSRLSTAFALDLFGAMLRGIYDGHSTYLNGGGMAGAGDEWGAIGSWYSGAWHTASSESYISIVQNHLANKPWLNGGF